MIEIGVLVFLVVAGILFALNAVWAWRFVLMFPPRKRHAPTERLPRTAVVLCIRGADPSLINCLNGLLNQDYPDFDIRIIIDSPEDPGWELIRQVLGPNYEGTVPVHVSLLEHRRDTCTLKVSALIQAISRLDESFEAVALIDADVVPHSNWLRDMVEPLTRPNIGAATGIRWYRPEKTNWGTMVRYLWNAVACTQMYAFNIPWGGSLAFRAEVVRRPGVLEKWAQSFCEDTSSYEILRGMGLKLAFVPAATMVNRETIDLKNCCQFIRRQLLTARLHHGSWQRIFWNGVSSSLAFVLGMGLLAGLGFLGRWDLAVPLGAVMTLYVGSMQAALFYYERHLGQMLRQRGEQAAALSWKIPLAASLTQILYLGCLTSASRLRRVDWRGITYELHGPQKIRLIEYRPYQVPEQASSESLV